MFCLGRAKAERVIDDKECCIEVNDGKAIGEYLGGKSCGKVAIVCQESLEREERCIQDRPNDDDPRAKKSMPFECLFSLERLLQRIHWLVFVCIRNEFAWQMKHTIDRYDANGPWQSEAIGGD